MEKGWKTKSINKMTNQEFDIYIEKCKVPKKLKSLIREYRDCFATNLEEIGEIRTTPSSFYTHKFKANWDGRPYQTIPYKQTPEAQEAIEAYVKEQLDAKMIEPVTDLTGWQHSCTTARKQDDKITGATNQVRVCVDYKPINAVTEIVGFTIPSKDEIVEQIGQWPKYITIDIKSAYNHIPIPKEHRHFLAFSIKNGEKYQPTRMNYGGINMPMIFAAAMRRAFRPLINNGWFYQYFDDLTIGGIDEEDLIRKIRQVLNLCRKTRLKIKLTKCDWLKEEIKLLGWIINKEGRRIDPKHLKTIKDWEWPKNPGSNEEFIKKLQSFKGLVNYCSRFIPNVSEMESHIQRAITDKNPNDERAQQMFEKIKQEILKERTLGRIDPDKKAIIYTDASHIQTGAVILQDEKEKLTPRAYYSYTFKKPEKKWTILRKEAFAIRKAFEKFRECLKWQMPGKIEVRTDNQTLVNILNKDDQCIDNEIAQIYQIVREKSIPITFVKGENNILADALSRKELYYNNINFFLIFT